MKALYIIIWRKNMNNLFGNIKYRIRPNRMFKRGRCHVWYGIKGVGKDTLCSIYFGSLALYIYKFDTFWSLDRRNLEG